MKILTNKQINSIRNEVINKMYDAVRRYYEYVEIRKSPNSETIPCLDHDIALHVVLEAFFEPPKRENKYEWCKGSDLKNLLKD